MHTIVSISFGIGGQHEWVTMDPAHLRVVDHIIVFCRVERVPGRHSL